jgi:hypothetical protein
VAHGRPGARSRRDRERPAGRGRPLAVVVSPSRREPAAGPAQSKPTPSSVTVSSRRPGSQREPNGDLRCGAGVAPGVVQRLLGDPNASFSTAAATGASPRSAVRSPACACAAARRRACRARPSPLGLERRPPQVDDREGSSSTVSRASSRTSVSCTPACRRPGRSAPHRLDREHAAEELLGHRVVQLAGEPVSRLDDAQPRASARAGGVFERQRARRGSRSAPDPRVGELLGALLVAEVERAGDHAAGQDRDAENELIEGCALGRRRRSRASRSGDAQLAVSTTERSRQRQPRKRGSWRMSGGRRGVRARASRRAGCAGAAARERGDQPVAHARRDEARKAAGASGHADRRAARARSRTASTSFCRTGSTPARPDREDRAAERLGGPMR